MSSFLICIHLCEHVSIYFCMILLFKSCDIALVFFREIFWSFWVEENFIWHRKFHSSRTRVCQITLKRIFWMSFSFFNITAYFSKALKYRFIIFRLNIHLFTNKKLASSVISNDQATNKLLSWELFKDSQRRNEFELNHLNYVTEILNLK